MVGEIRLYNKQEVLLFVVVGFFAGLVVGLLLRVLAVLLLLGGITYLIVVLKNRKK